QRLHKRLSDGEARLAHELTGECRHAPFVLCRFSASDFPVFDINADAGVSAFPTKYSCQRRTWAGTDIHPREDFPGVAALAATEGCQCHQRQSVQSLPG